MTNWPGTFLSAVFVAPSSLWIALPKVLAEWHESGILSSGTAKWMKLPPTQVSYDAVMIGPPCYETAWSDDVTALLEQAIKASLLQLTFSFPWEHGQGQVILDVMVNSDNSVGLYLNAPYSQVYEEQSPQVGHLNIDRFVDLACLMFSPSEFVLGVINEEAQLPGLTEESEWPDDWAFYGVGLSKLLYPLLTSLSTQSPDIRKVHGGGLFVRWTRWEEPTTSPKEWRLVLHQAQTAYLRTLQ